MRTRSSPSRRRVGAAVGVGALLVAAGALPGIVGAAGVPSTEPAARLTLATAPDQIIVVGGGGAGLGGGSCVGMPTTTILTTLAGAPAGSVSVVPTATGATVTAG